MFLKRLIFKVLNNEKQAILVYLINTALLILIFSLMLEKLSILYPLFVSLTILALYIIFKAIRMNAFLRDLDAAKTQTEGLYAENAFVKEVYNTIDEIHRSYGIKLSKLKQQLDGRNSLFSQFVHNMKSSVSIISLACEKKADSSVSDISMENEKLKKIWSRRLIFYVWMNFQMIMYRKKLIYPTWLRK